MFFATNVSDPIENQLTRYLNFSNSGTLPQFCQMLANACANQSAPQFYIMRQPKAKRELSRRKKEINCFQMVKIVGIWNNLSNFTRMLLKICTFHFYRLLSPQNTYNLFYVFLSTSSGHTLGLKGIRKWKWINYFAI